MVEVLKKSRYSPLPPREGGRLQLSNNDGGVKMNKGAKPAILLEKAQRFRFKNEISASLQFSGACIFEDHMMY